MLLAQSSIVLIDQFIVQLMPLWRTAGRTTFFLLFTSLGSEIAAGLVFSGALVLLYLRKKKRYFWPLLISCSGAGLFNYAAKYFFHRPRPEHPVYLEANYSFPSGHAILALALYGFIFFIFWKEAKTNLQKTISLYLSVIFIGLIGFSRIYLGVHYLSDVIAGYLAGLLFLILGIFLVARKT